MRKLLNTLFVTTQGAQLRRDGETVLVQVQREDKLRLPVHTLSGVVCFGRVWCSPQLMELCASRQVPISFLSEKGRFFARVQGGVSGNVLLRREQYRRADDHGQTSELARAFIIGKVANDRTVLLRAMRDHSTGADISALDRASAQLARVLEQLREPGPLALVRGKEGEAAKAYFAVFDHLIVAQKGAFQFHERSRRPPLDNINALLSFVYTLLVHDVVGACEAVGLDPAVGFLHRDRPGRPGLALDLMEELRPFLADRLVLSLINRQQVRPDGFSRGETGAVTMGDDTRRELLVAYQKRKQEEVHHPFLDEKLPAGMIPFAQALLLARHLRGDLDGYPPFLWK
ncbi:MAG TPA: type I-C CRISPR-associated endonuclease Cas1c [Verrucomicrobiota bacterium]|nr:type I-C CRISPR-associated endonuclease Cas1c [Verrucomicrobiota bacterium]